MGGGIGQWIDNLQVPNDRAWPSVRDDERQRILVFRTHMNEMNVQSIDLGEELRQRVKPRLDLAPIVIIPPIFRECLNIVASCTPCDASVTVSLSGHLVALMRLRISTSSASGIFTTNGRMGVLSMPACWAVVVVVMVLTPSEDQKDPRRWENRRVQRILQGDRAPSRLFTLVGLAMLSSPLAKRCL
jgi:hypothetical protein